MMTDDELLLKAGKAVLGCDDLFAVLISINKNDPLNVGGSLRVTLRSQDKEVCVSFSRCMLEELPAQVLPSVLAQQIGEAKAQLRVNLADQAVKIPRKLLW